MYTFKPKAHLSIDCCVCGETLFESVAQTSEEFQEQMNNAMMQLNQTNVNVNQNSDITCSYCVAAETP